jgi:hypothetical protein
VHEFIPIHTHPPPPISFVFLLTAIRSASFSLPTPPTPPTPPPFSFLQYTIQNFSFLSASNISHPRNTTDRKTSQRSQGDTQSAEYDKEKHRQSAAMAPDLNSVPLSPRQEFTLSAPDVASPPPRFSSKPASKQPNILYIMADQLAAPLLKMHNPDSKIKTPHLDTLAEGAVIFDSAYCPSPLCAPSRMSMVTGQLPTKIGSYDNACSIDPSTPTYAHYLRAAGYETTLAGKMHFIGEQLHGYESRLTSDIYPGDYGWAVNWEDPEKRLEWYHNASSIEQAGPCVRSNQLDYDEEVMYK